MGDDQTPPLVGATSKKKPIFERFLEQVFWVLCFLPIIIFLVLKSQHLSLALGLAALCSLAVVLLRIFNWWRGTCKEWLDNLNAAFVSVFAVLFVLSFFLPQSFSQPWFPVITMWWITAWVLVGMLVGHPFTATYGKDSIPEEQWDKPWFKRAFMIFTAFWLVTFFIMAVSNTVMAVVDVLHVRTMPVFLVFQFILPFASLFAAIALTQWYKWYIKERARRKGVLPPGV
eukprot:jgi/Botrbrau1/1064/Bobra.0076s0030.1